MATGNLIPELTHTARNSTSKKNESESDRKEKSTTNASQFSLLNHIKPRKKTGFIKNYYVTTWRISTIRFGFCSRKISAPTPPWKSITNFHSNIRFLSPIAHLQTHTHWLGGQHFISLSSFFNACPIFAFNQINLHKTFSLPPNNTQLNVNLPNRHRPPSPTQQQQWQHFGKKLQIFDVVGSIFRFEKSKPERGRKSESAKHQ